MKIAKPVGCPVEFDAKEIEAIENVRILIEEMQGYLYSYDLTDYLTENEDSFDNAELQQLYETLSKLADVCIAY